MVNIYNDELKKVSFTFAFKKNWKSLNTFMIQIPTEFWGQ